jgi:hypothetical protein
MYQLTCIINGMGISIINFQLSFNDIRLMNTIYCKDACPKKLPCLRGGYTDPRHIFSPIFWCLYKILHTLGAVIDADVLTVLRAW